MKNRITAEEVMTVLAYHLELFAMPTRHKYGTTYEQWLYQNGLLRRVRYLEEERLLARERADSGWVYRLTETGRKAVRGVCDPETLWRRSWDGWWRLLVFDLPVQQGHKRLRRSLIRWLRQNWFGYLQDSVWVSPDPLAGQLRSESIACHHAFSLDPLLPRALLPREYLGVKAWQARRRSLTAVAERIASLKPVA